MKRVAKKTGIWLAILTTLGSVATAVVKVIDEKDKRQQFEVFFSNYQDEIKCRQQHEDSLHNSKINCNN